jgi:hypothetical protein
MMQCPELMMQGRLRPCSPEAPPRAARAIYPNAAGRGEMGAAMKFDLKSIYLIAS